MFTCEDVPHLELDSTLLLRTDMEAGCEAHFENDFRYMGIEVLKVSYLS